MCPSRRQKAVACVLVQTSLYRRGERDSEKVLRCGTQSLTYQPCLCDLNPFAIAVEVEDASWVRRVANG